MAFELQWFIMPSHQTSRIVIEMAQFVLCTRSILCPGMSCMLVRQAVKYLAIGQHEYLDIKDDPVEQLAMAEMSTA